jgi:hypothetical protein
MPVISNKQQIKENLKYDFSSFQRQQFGKITELLSRGKIYISNIDIVIINVGTNNIFP